MSNPRAEFSSIFARKPLKLPGGARVAVWRNGISMNPWPVRCFPLHKECLLYRTSPTLGGSIMD